jgi:hypothetical protein
MALRWRRDRTGPPDQIIQIGRQLARDDPLVFRVASQAVDDWLERFPQIARAASQSDDRATDSTRMLSEAFMAASATQAVADAGEADAGSIFNEQFDIAQEQTALGVAKEWVVAFMQIRCFAAGYMLGALGRRAECEELGRLFNTFVEQVQQAK